MAETDPKPKSRRWIRVLLFVSLALNLLVLGAVVGRVLGDGPPDRRHPRGGDDAAIPYTRAFDPEQRKELWRGLRGTFEGRREGGGFLDGYREALTLLRAEPFDQAAFEALLDRQATEAEGRRRAGQKVLADYLGTMSAADRQAYAARLEEGLQRIIDRRAGKARD